MTTTVPGCAPQLPDHERPMTAFVNPENSWAAAMEVIKPVQPARIPETSVGGLPAFRCEQVAGGKWQFLCTCGHTHEHSAREGRHGSRCDAHITHGYHLLAPINFIPQQRPASTSPSQDTP